MNGDMCKLIYDILPLYLEGEVSEETQNVIDEHIKSCERCKRLVSDYNNDAVPQPENTSESLDRAEDFKKLMKKIKGLAVKILAAVLVVILVIGAVSYSAGLHNRERITYVKTEEDVIKYYFERIPGLRRGQREGNYQNIGRIAELPEGLGRVGFNKIWYTNKSIYVFYSIRPGKDAGHIEDIQLSGKLIWQGDSEISAAGSMGGMYIGEWVSYDGEYYKVIEFPNDKERFNPSNGQSLENLKLDLKMTYIPVKDSFKQADVKVPEVEFPVVYDPVKEKGYTLDINKSIKLDKGIEVNFKQLIMEPQKTYITLDYFAPGGEVIGLLKGSLTTDNGERKSLWLPPVETGSNPMYMIELDPLDYVPSDVKIKFDEVRLITAESLKFEIDAKQYHGKLKEQGETKKINRKIGSAGSTNFTLESLYWDDRGVSFTILSDAKQLSSSGVYNDTNNINSWASEEYYKESLAKEGKTLNRRVPNLAKLTNEKGEAAQMEDYGQGGSGPAQRMSRFIDKKFIEKSDTIYVEIYNLVETISGRWTAE